MYSDIWAPMLTNNSSLCNKSLHAFMKIAHGELFGGDARFVLFYAMKTENARGRKYFLLSGKKGKVKNLFYNLIPDALRDLNIS